jgi:hypothetical protein
MCSAEGMQEMQACLMHLARHPPYKAFPLQEILLSEPAMVGTGRNIVS